MLQLRKIVGWERLNAFSLRSQSTFGSLLLEVFKMKSFNETVLAFLSFESKTNILYVNINFTGNLFLGFGRYWGKVLPEPAVFHFFRVPALTNNVLPIFFSCWLVVNNSRNKRVSAFLLYFIGFETINFYIIFFIKMSYFGSNLFF